mgnify:CR=1 FL=1
MICIGKATKLIEKLICEDKIYETTIKLGIATDTADVTGNILKIQNLENNEIKENNLKDFYKEFEEIIKNDKIKYSNEIEKARGDYNRKFLANNNRRANLKIGEISDKIRKFEGKQEQRPPIYSSIKINGKKLYEYARNGEMVEIPKRNIEIFKIDNISWNDKDEISYKVHCSKGTYIRSLNEDIAKSLGFIGTTYELRRLKSGNFDIKNAITLEEIDESKIITIDKLFDKKIELNKIEIEKLLNGILLDFNDKNGIYKVYCNGEFVGLGKLENNKLKRYII